MFKQLRSFYERIFYQKWSIGLFSIIGLIYIPFLGNRFIRTAGDEKVYINQSLEMARDGNWFVQTLNDVPDYYKGPLHYIFLRLGKLFLGLSPWSLFYMNLIAVTVGAWALASVVARRFPSWRGGPLFIGAFFASTFGIYAHVYASQMEIELAAMFALGIYLLDRLEPASAGWWFWIVAGITGWIKAPLHSLFLGISAIIYWVGTGQVLLKIRNWKAWAAAFTGILLCCVGFAPAFFLDRTNFISQYIYKEIILKSGTQQSAWTPIASLFGFYLFPWAFLAWVAYFKIIARTKNVLIANPYRNQFILGLSLLIPTVSFFIWHDYRFENYNLPAMSGLLLCLVAVLIHGFESDKLFKTLVKVSFVLTGLLMLVLPVVFMWIKFHFEVMPRWWPGWVLPACSISSVLGAFTIFYCGAIRREIEWVGLALGSTGLLVALGMFFSVLGEREMVDLRSELAIAKIRGVPPTLVYCNLEKNIWSEWGILSHMLRYPVTNAYDSKQLIKAVDTGSWILVPNREIELFKKAIADSLPGLDGGLGRFNIRIWQRWRTHGQTPDGRPLWKQAWDEKNIGLLEQPFWIARPRK